MKKLPVILKRTPHSPHVTITGAGITQFCNNVVLRAKTDDGFRSIELRADRRVLLEILYQLIERLEIPEHPDPDHPPQKANRLTPDAVDELNNWDWLTPQMVIDKFAASPNLRPMLDDVMAILGDDTTTNHDIEEVKTRLDPAELFTPDGSPKRGAQSKVAAALGIKNAGGHRRRIFRVLNTLKAA